MFWRKKRRRTRLRNLVPISTRDRGPATFFHGREKELAAFKTACEEAHRDNSGAILIFQGPPGAGKTALLHECRKRAQANGWSTADIKGDALHDPGILARELNFVSPDKVLDHYGNDLRLGLKAILRLVFRRTTGQTLEYRGDSIKEVLRKAASSRGVVLTLDEAQNMEVGVQTKAAEKPAISLSLEWIHNGTVGAPVILLAAGLGTSKAVIESFGISRFLGGAIHLMESLDDEAAQKVIRDWLVRSGGAPEDHPFLEHWVVTLAAECYGWPQHIQRYMPAAAKWLRDHGHMPSGQVPQSILDEGRANREEYYDGRVSGLGEQDRVALADLVRRKGKHSNSLRKILWTPFPGSAIEKKQGLYSTIFCIRG